MDVKVRYLYIDISIMPLIFNVVLWYAQKQNAVPFQEFLNMKSPHR